MNRKKIISLVLLVLFALAAAGTVYAAQKHAICGGTGKITHSACNGTGKSKSGVQHADGSFTANKCVGCDGRGWILCPGCKGKGWL
jgi:hypothetical protein